MTRILLLSPADLHLPDQAIADGLLDHDTRIVHHRVTFPSCPPVSAHDWALADFAILAAGQEAESDGFQAVCLGDFGDYGAAALRSVLDIPVITAGRASMLHALTLGASFRICASERDRARAKKMVHEYGLDAHCQSICAPEELADALGAEEGEPVIMALRQSRLGGPGVTGLVIDPLSVALKICESMVSLHLTHSRKAYPEPQVRKQDLIAALAHAIRSDV